MLHRVSIKFGILFFVIIMLDSLLDMVLGLSNLVIHLTHLIIEVIEYSLELLLAHTLQTNAHQSETIIVNAAIIITLLLTYRLSIAAPRWYLGFKRDLRAACLWYIRRETSCWQAMTLSHKIKWVSTYSAGTLFFLLVIV